MNNILLQISGGSSSGVSSIGGEFEAMMQMLYIIEGIALVLTLALAFLVYFKIVRPRCWSGLLFWVLVIFGQILTILVYWIISLRGGATGGRRGGIA